MLFPLFILSSCACVGLAVSGMRERPRLEFLAGLLLITSLALLGYLLKLRF